EFSSKEATKLAGKVTDKLSQEYDGTIPTVEQIQDEVEDILMNSSYKTTAKAYIVYRDERSKVRGSKSRLMSQFDIITGSLAKDSSDLKRSNANVNGDTAMGKMLQYGEEGSKEYAKTFLLRPEHVRAHDDGDSRSDIRLIKTDDPAIPLLHRLQHPALLMTLFVAYAICCVYDRLYSPRYGVVKK
ncbi:hypothetical protein EUA61_02820, partial [TM7 phylum sp. oral taxon 346]